MVIKKNLGPAQLESSLMKDWRGKITPKRVTRHNDVAGLGVAVFFAFVVREIVSRQRTERANENCYAPGDRCP
jgi:hypothetical protein